MSILSFASFALVFKFLQYGNHVGHRISAVRHIELIF
jgi:hypothetical protein